MERCWEVNGKKGTEGGAKPYEVTGEFAPLGGGGEILKEGEIPSDIAWWLIEFPTTPKRVILAWVQSGSSSIKVIA